jgi:SAM domain (Sterile alpha motif)
MAALPDLTDQHLKDLDVSLGHRLKMLGAIRGLGNAPVLAVSHSTSEPTRRDEAKGRQLTLMFTDLIGRLRSNQA